MFWCCIMKWKYLLSNTHPGHHNKLVFVKFNQCLWKINVDVENKYLILLMVILVYDCFYNWSIYGCVYYILLNDLSRGHW